MYIYYYMLKNKDRYKSEPIGDMEHLLNCIKYIHENPVKANIVKECNQYIYSSYNEFLNDSKIYENLQQFCHIEREEYTDVITNTHTDKKYIEMEALEKYLINKEVGIIKLLDPPFEKGNIEPGYIKSYLPGVRENGGQYTHSAIWAVIAFAKLKLEDKKLHKWIVDKQKSTYVRIKEN